MPQFNRKCQVIIQANEQYIEGSGLSLTKTIENLRIEFDVQKGLSPYNKTRVSIYNLSESNRRWIETHANGAKITVNARYADNPSWQLVGRADMTLARSRFDQPNIITELNCDDGRGVLESPVSVSAKKDAKAVDALQEIKNQLKASIRDPQGLIDKVFKIGYAFNGQAKDAFEDLSRKYEADYNSIDGEIVFVPYDGYLPGQVIVVDETSGMIGVPEKLDDIMSLSGRQKKKNIGQPAKNPGFEVTTLLNPRLTPGGRIRLVSKRLNIDGEYKIEQVQHRGDTHGETWESQARVRVLK